MALEVLAVMRLAVRALQVTTAHLEVRMSCSVLLEVSAHLEASTPRSVVLASTSRTGRGAILRKILVIASVVLPASIAQTEPLTQ